jgi:RimJ/RimL family protein N-acetyltransferase
VISIEPLTAEHFPVVATWLSKPEINEWLTSEWRQRSIDGTVIGIAVRNKRNKFYLVRAEGSPCGLVALADLDFSDRVGMVWYALGDPASGGRGVITEAVRQLLATAFQELGLEAIHAWIMEDNHRSRSVLVKNGFREAGRLRQAAVRNDVRIDRIYFDITRP